MCMYGSGMKILLYANTEQIPTSFIVRQNLNLKKTSQRYLSFEEMRIRENKKKYCLFYTYFCVNFILPTSS